MATNITLYSVAKRINSTFRPTEGTVYPCTIKDRCGVVNPVLLLEATEMRNYNYGYWDNKYYWIDEITFIRNNLWEITLSLDALATYKTNIQETTAFVLYAKDNYNLYAMDPRQVPTVTSSVDVQSADIGGFNSTGTYFLATVGANQSSSNFCNLYGMTADALSQVANIVTSDTTILTEFKEYFASALECLVSAYWLPVSVATSGSTVKIGNFDTGVSAGLVTTGYYHTLVTLTPPWKNNYLDSDAYTKMFLYLPYVGCVELGVSDFLRGSIQVQVCVDEKSGGITYVVQKTGSNQIIATYTGNCITKLPISTYKQDVGATVNGAVSLVDNIASVGSSIAGIASLEGITNLGASIGGVINSVMGAVGSGVNLAMTAMKRTPSCFGGMTGLSAAGFPFSNSVILVTLSTGYTDPITAKTSVCGLPVFQTRPLSQFTGYVQTAGASVGCNCPRPVLNSINAALDGGIYIE